MGGVECKERGGRQVAVMEVSSLCPRLTSSNVAAASSGDGGGEWRGGEGRGGEGRRGEGGGAADGVALSFR